MKTVFIQGSYDILNAGHVKSLEKAKKLSKGGILIVGLNSDELYRSYKDNRGPIIPYRQRKIILEAMRCVDKVIQMDTMSPIKELKHYGVDIYVITKEWLKTKKKELEYMEKKGGKVVFSPRFTDNTDLMCSTDIRNRVIQRETS